MRRTVTALCLLSLVACDRGKDSAPAPATGPVTVFAASSLNELMTEISGQWKAKSGRDLKLQFEASSTLARQIKEGAPVDLFVTAAPEWLDELKVLDRYDWLSNTLVVVVRKDTADFDLKDVKSLALANEQVPAGKYAVAALAHLGIKMPERAVYGSSVRDVLSKVSEAGAEAGIVYATDAAVDPAVRIAYTFPAESHPRILYSVGVLTESGRDLAAALQEPSARETAKRMGFVELK